MSDTIIVFKAESIRIQHEVTGESIMLYAVENDLEFSLDGLVPDTKMTNGPAVTTYSQQPGKIRIGSANNGELINYIKRHRNIIGHYNVRATMDQDFGVTYSASLNIPELSFKANDHKVDITFTGKVIS